MPCARRSARSVDSAAARSRWRLAGRGDQHDRHRDREQHRSADREPGARAGPAPQPGRELVECRGVARSAGRTRERQYRADRYAKHKHRFARLGVSCAYDARRPPPPPAERARRGAGRSPRWPGPSGTRASAVSQSLAQLEREAGMALLERDGRNVRLDAAARRLVVRADRVLAELDAAESELAAEHGGVRGEVVIGAFPSAAAHLVVPAVRALHERHPELALPRPRARARGRDPAAALGRARPADLRELRRRLPRPRRRPRTPVLLTEPLLLVSDAPRASEPVELRTLADAPWIGGTEQFAGALERAFRRRASRPGSSTAPTRRRSSRRSPPPGWASGCFRPWPAHPRPACTTRASIARAAAPAHHRAAAARGGRATRAGRDAGGAVPPTSSSPAV